MKVTMETPTTTRAASKRRRTMYEPISGPPLHGVQRVAQAVAEQVEAEHRQHDGQAGEEHKPGRAAIVALSFVDHPAPGGRGRLDADAQEAERCLEQHVG